MLVVAMQPYAPFSCPACGNVVSTGGGRCPHCGQDLPGTHGASQPHRVVRARPPAARPKPRIASIAVAIGAAVVGVGAIVVIASQVKQLSQGPTAPPSASSGMLVPAPRAASAPKRVDPSLKLADAKKSALAWHSDALLVSLEAYPVAGGLVNVEKDGRIRFEFGAPRRGTLGPGAPVTARRFVVTFDKAGWREAEQTRNGPARAVAEPDCPASEAWRKVVATGVPSTDEIRLSYALDKKRNRAIWRAEPAMLRDRQSYVRLLDGRTCAILTR